MPEDVEKTGPTPDPVAEIPEEDFDQSLIETDDDKALAEIMGVEVQEKPDEKTEAGGDEPAPDADDAQPGEDKPQEESPDSPQVEAEPEGYAEAMNVLKRGKTPQGLIDRLTPQEVVDMAGELKPIQSESDGFGNKFADLKKELEELKDLSRNPQAKEPEPDRNDLFRLIEKELGAETSDALSKLIKEAPNQADGSQQDEIGRRIQQIEDRQNQLINNQLLKQTTDAREGLMSKFPRLKSADVYLSVRQRMDSLNSASDSGERYGGDVDKLMLDAVRLELGPEMSSEAKEKFVDEHSNRVSSQQDVADKQDNRQTPQNLTRDTADNLILTHLENGDEVKAKEVEARFKKQNRS